MPKSNTIASSLNAAAPLKAPAENPKPEVGAKVLLSWAPYGIMAEVLGGEPMYPGVYVEVEVKSIKTAKLLLE